MKLDLISWKWDERLLSINTLIIFGYALLLGYVPYGYYFMLAFMTYFIMRENEEKYIFLLGYFVSCASKGILYSYEQMLIVGIWFVVVMVFYMLWHNPIGGIHGFSVLLLAFYSVYLGMPFLEISKYILFYLLYAIVVRKMFFKVNEVLLFIGISLVFLLYNYYIPMIMNIDASLFLQSLLLICVGSNLSLSSLLILLVVCIGGGGSSDYYIPVILFWVLCKKFKTSSILIYIVYLVSLYSVCQNIFYIICGGIFVAVVIILNKDIENIEETSEEIISGYDSSTRLLKQFSKICRSMVNAGVESSLIQVISEVFENSANELEHLSHYDHYPTLIKDVLAAYHYEIHALETHYDNALFISLQLYNTNKTDIKNTLIPILETALHTTLYLQEYQNANLLHSYHECTLIAHPCIAIKYDYLQKAKQEVCGDEINVLSRFEKKAFFLSDGMGDGYTAKNQSEFAISFLSELFLIGIPFIQMIRIINQFLLLKQNESFATLDIVCIDTVSRQCYLYKAGSALTYLVRDNAVHCFEAQSLPLGIVSRIAPDVYCFELKENDLIVMMSDGAESEVMEQWLMEFQNKQPSALLSEIYSRKEEEKIVDDLSILALKVQNNFHFL